jgi:disulfide bond formation protein DsbB
MNYEAAPHIDPVVAVKRASCDEMRADWRFLSGVQAKIFEASALFVAMAAACLHCPADHGKEA